MGSLHRTSKGIMALLLAMSLTACLTPFGDVTVPGDTTNTTGSTTTGGTTSGGGIACDSKYSTATGTMCTQWSSASGQASCLSGETQVSSCPGTNRCVLTSYVTIYYGGSYASSSSQSSCLNSNGTWY